MNIKNIILVFILFLPFQLITGQDKMNAIPFRHWRVGVQAGGSYIFSSSSEGEKEMLKLGVSKAKAKDYYKHLRQGVQAGGDIHYLFNDYIGVGMKYLFFSSSANADFAAETGDGINYVFMRDEERMYINYFGPSAISEQWLGKGRKFKLTEEVSLGLAHYRDEVRFDLSQYAPTGNMLATGYTLGGNAGVSIEYYPVKWISVGANAGIFSATFYKFNVSNNQSSTTVDLEAKDFENISRMDYSLGVRFHF